MIGVPGRTERILWASSTPVISGIVRSLITAHMSAGAAWNAASASVGLAKAAAAIPPAAPAPARNADFAPFGLGRRIMLVDDQEEVRVTGAILLRKLGFAPSSYANPADALADFKAAPNEICAVVSDLTMPEMTGVELAEKVLAVRPGTPIIIASGYLPVETREKFLALGVSSIIGKPFELKEITERVRSAVGS